MDKGRTVLIQDVEQLINIGRTHILFDHEVFKTDLFLEYKETMGTLFSTSVNPVYKSLKAFTPEISSQLTNFHSDNNGHQSTSMDFLCYNFRKINDNVVTVKNDFSCTTTAIDVWFFKYFSGYERGYNYPEQLLDESNNPSDQVVNTNSSET